MNYRPGKEECFVISPPITVKGDLKELRVPRNLTREARVAWWHSVLKVTAITAIALDAILVLTWLLLSRKWELEFGIAIILISAYPMLLHLFAIWWLGRSSPYYIDTDRQRQIIEALHELKNTCHCSHCRPPSKPEGHRDHCPECYPPRPPLHREG